MRKKIFCISFMLAAAFVTNSFLILPVSAEEKPLEYDQLNYEIAEDGHITITNCYQSAVECVIPEEIDGASVTEIADSAFSECFLLKKLTIPDSIKIIGRQAFSACSVLESVQMPSEIDEIREGAFDGCAALKSIDMPKGITELPEATFYECTALKEIIFQDDIEIIGSESFYGCSSLSDITLPESVTTIADYAFQGCTSLSSINFPENVQNLGGYIFQDCKSLTDIVVDDDNSMFTDKDGVLFTKDGITLVRYPQAKQEESYIVPEGCTQLANGSFVDAVYLKNIELGSATVYGMDVFFRCTALESITIPEGTENLGSSMFAYCSSIKDVSLPSSLKTIGDYAFYTCAALSEITVPEGVQELGSYSFFNCIELRTLRLPDSITSIGDGAIGYYAESEDTEPKKLDGVTVEYKHNDVIHSFVEQYDLVGTGSGSSRLWIWFVSIVGAVLVIGAIILIVILRRRAAVPKPVPGGRTGSETKRTASEKKG